MSATKNAFRRPQVRADHRSISSAHPWRGFVLGAAATLAVATLAHAAEPIVLTGRARAPVIEGRTLEARGRAVKAALDDAILKATARLIGIDSGEFTIEQLDEVRAATAGLEGELVTRRDILRDEHVGDSYIIEMRVSIREARLQNALRSTSLLGGRARTRALIVVLIGDLQARRVRGAPVVTTELQSALLASGFRVVDAAQVEALQRRDEVEQASRGDVAAARAIARRFAADAVLCGTAANDPLPRNPVGFASRARLDARLYHTDTGELIAAHGLQKSGIDGNPEAAARRAYANAAQELGVVISGKYQAWELARSVTTRTITVHVSGLPYVQYARLKQALDDGLPGMRGYRLRSYDDRAEWVELEAEYNGNSERLADAIAAEQFAEFKLSIRDVTPNRIQLKAGPK